MRVLLIQACGLFLDGGTPKLNAIISNPMSKKGMKSFS